MTPWIMLTFIMLLDLSLRVLLGLGNWSPDLLLLGIIYMSINFPLGQAYTMAFVFGLLWDAAYLDNMGLHSLLFILAVMGSNKMRQFIWAQYAVSRFVLGFVLSGTVRFGEVIYWLSNIDHRVLYDAAQNYVLSGALVTGLCFFIVSWEPLPVQVPRKTPVMYGER